jgi:transposase
MSPTSIAEIKNIDHLGIVAGLIDEIGIVEIINSKLGIDPREKVTAGILVKAILINGLGFVSRPLYLFSQFFVRVASRRDRQRNRNIIGRRCEK